MRSPRTLSKALAAVGIELYDGKRHDDGPAFDRVWRMRAFGRKGPEIGLRTGSDWAYNSGWSSLNLLADDIFVRADSFVELLPEGMPVDSETASNVRKIRNPYAGCKSIEELKLRMAVLDG